MSQFLGFLFGLYVVGTFVAWPICWWTRTNRSQAPLERRLLSLGYALQWPYTLYCKFSGRATPGSVRGNFSRATPPSSSSTHVTSASAGKATMNTQATQQVHLSNRKQ